MRHAPSHTVVCAHPARTDGIRVYSRDATIGLAQEVPLEDGAAGLRASDALWVDQEATALGADRKGCLADPVAAPPDGLPVDDHGDAEGDTAEGGMEAGWRCDGRGEVVIGESRVD